MVTSDGMIQLSALRSGVTRLSSREFLLEVERTDEKIREVVEKAKAGSRVTIGDEVHLQAEEEET